MSKLFCFEADPWTGIIQGGGVQNDICLFSKMSKKIHVGIYMNKISGSKINKCQHMSVLMAVLSMKMRSIDGYIYI